MKILVLTCSKPSALGGKTGSCPSNQRTWQELEIPDITFWESLVTTFDAQYFTLILTASFTGLAIGFGAGLVMNAVKRGRNL